MSNLKIIIVGGMIGVGKTSLIENLCNKLKDKEKKVKVVYEIWEDKFENVFSSKNNYDVFMEELINEYYINLDLLKKSELNKDIERYDFYLKKLATHQIHFLSTRTSKVFSAINTAIEEQLDYLILDRSLYEDIVFTSLSLKNDEDLWAKYYKIWEYWEATFNNVVSKYNAQHFILDAPIDIILERIQKRGREFEQGEQVFDYFKNLNKKYVVQILEEFTKKNIRNFSKIDTSNFTSNELAAEVITHYLR